MCGIFGIWNHHNASELTALGLHALQHRGEESCGIATQTHIERYAGLVGDSFSNEQTLNKLEGNAAIGHVRYSTQGGSSISNAQPLSAELDIGRITIAHNGNISNSSMLKRELMHDGIIFQTNSDTEIILHMTAKSRKLRMVDRFVDALDSIEGGYAIVALTHKKMIGVRDPHGIRPLCLGRLNGQYILASESCAFSIIDAEYIRDIKNGEVVVITNDGLKSYFPFEQKDLRPCIFEFVYFSRPDSIFNDRSIYHYRKNAGIQLANEINIDADMVSPVPDSGVSAAIGYAEQSKIPYTMAMIRNHYIGRSFIFPTQSIRDLKVKMKLSATQNELNGKRIILIDDSLVRGTTSKKIIRMIRNAGAKEIHLLIASPPVKHPDYYGIDTPNQNELLAHTHTIKQMQEYIGADGLYFLSIEGLYRSLGYEYRPFSPQFADHCFTGDYPI